MKSKTLFTAFILSISTSLIVVSQNSLGEQNSSVRQKIENITPNTTSNAAHSVELKVSDFKKDERHQREFKDGLITGITFPEGDAAAKSEPTSSSPSVKIKDIRK